MLIFSETGVTHVQTKVNGSAAFLIDDITCHKHDLYDTNGTKMFEINKYGKSIMPAWIDRLTWKTPTLTINHVQQEDAGFYSINKTDSSLNGPICDKRGFQLEVIVPGM